jgi:hypothetical protein
MDASTSGAVVGRPASMRTWPDGDVTRTALRHRVPTK